MITGFSIGDTWYQALSEILRNGKPQKVQKGSFEGTFRHQLDFAVLEITNPGSRPLSPFVPSNVSPPTDEESIEKYARDYLLSPEVPKNTTYTYGARIHEQLFPIIDMLRDTPGTNHAVLEIRKPSDVALDDPPCLCLAQFQVHSGKLNMYLYFRSWDGWAGLPTNLGGLQILKEFVAGEAGYMDGKIVAASAGLHLWEYSIDEARKVIAGG